MNAQTFAAIAWSAPIPIETLRADRSQLPPVPGVYVFTNYFGPVQNDTGVLYIGKAKSLFTRVQSYLADPAGVLIMSTRSATPRVNTSLRHPGKVQLLVKLQQKSRGTGPSGIWVRWTLTSSAAAAKTLETSLLDYLKPAFNTQGV